MKLEELRKRLRSYVEPKRSEKQPSKHKKARKTKDGIDNLTPVRRIDIVCPRCQSDATVDVYRSKYQNERVTGLRDGGAWMCPHCRHIQTVELAP